MSQRFDLRNPPRWCRVLCVATVTTMPGLLAGAMASLIFGDIAMNSALGASAGAIFGVLVEVL